MRDRDYERLEQLQTQVYELKASLGIMSALMEWDLEDGRVRATPTRKEYLAEARKLSRYEVAP